MFQIVKGFRKTDLRYVVEEIGESVPENYTVALLKDIILNSEEYKKDPEFVQGLLLTAITDRREKEKYEQELEKEKMNRDAELEKEKMNRDAELEKEKMNRDAELEQKKMNAELELKKLEVNLQIELAKVQTPEKDQYEYIPNGSESSNAKRKFSLPKLEFRQFDGELKGWLPFWSQFSQIHTDEDIVPENKFQYLIQATVAGSRAREVVESFPPTAPNYAKAIESLRTRFGREDLLVEVYVRELLKLIVSVQSKEKFSLPSLYDKLESYLRALETLGVTTEKCASILYPMVESCFTAEFLKAWNRTHTASISSDAKERLDDLMRFLKSEVEGDERIKLAVAGFGLARKKDDKLREREVHKEVTESLPTAAALLATTPTSILKKNCVFCNGKHLSSECFSARKMSFAEKQNILRDKRCCFSCLASGHTTKQCRAIVRCFFCDKKHSSVVCQPSGRNTATRRHSRGHRKTVADSFRLQQKK